MFFKTFPVWKDAPFLRLVIPLILGIILQWYLHTGLIFDWSFFFASFVLLLLFQFSKPFTVFKFYWINGILLNILLLCTGMLLTRYNDGSNQTGWINHF